LETAQDEFDSAEGDLDECKGDKDDGGEEPNTCNKAEEEGGWTWNQKYHNAKISLKSATEDADKAEKFAKEIKLGGYCCHAGFKRRGAYDMKTLKYVTGFHLGICQTYQYHNAGDHTMEYKGMKARGMNIKAMNYGVKGFLEKKDDDDMLLELDGVKPKGGDDEVEVKDAPSSPETDDKKKSNNMAIIIPIVLVGVAAIGGGIYYYKKKN